MLAIRQENTSQNSVTLLWHEPGQPNGVILEYDIKYYEKVLLNLYHSRTALRKHIKAAYFPNTAHIKLFRHFM